MKVIGLVSGGKDSAFSLLECVALGHEIVALANLYPDAPSEELDSFCFQTVGYKLVPAIASCLELPLYRRKTQGRATQETVSYSSAAAHADDEVEDLHALLAAVKEAHPDATAVCSGAILSHYQRARIENVCGRLGFLSLGFLWQRPQRRLLEDMIAAPLNAILVKVSSMGLEPKHLGKSIQEMKATLFRLNDQWNVNPCGEGGEYETMTLDGPDHLFKKKIVIDEASNVDGQAGAAFLCVNSVHVEHKATGGREDMAGIMAEWVHEVPIVPVDHAIAGPIEAVTTVATQPAGVLFNAGSASTAGAFVHVGGVHCAAAPADITLDQEVRAVMGEVQTRLAAHGAQWSDVYYVHLFIHDMSQFGPINTAYCAFFDGVNPPSRSCVQTPLLGQESGAPRIIVEAIALRQSGAALRGTAPWADTVRRSTLHVGSYSRWAPICIGPYCQCNVVDSVCWLAGQIALVPQTMEMCSPPDDTSPEALIQQTRWSLASMRNVLQSQEASITGLFSLLAYVATPAVGKGVKLVDAAHMQPFLELVYSVVFHNAEPGLEEDLFVPSETDESSTGPLARGSSGVVVVQMPVLPKRALVEMEGGAFTNERRGDDAAVRSLRTMVLPVPTESLTTVTAAAAAVQTQVAAVLGEVLGATLRHVRVLLDAAWWSTIAPSLSAGSEALAAALPDTAVTVVPSDGLAVLSPDATAKQYECVVQLLLAAA